MVTLCILDGFGITDKEIGNAIKDIEIYTSKNIKNIYK